MCVCVCSVCVCVCCVCKQEVTRSHSNAFFFSAKLQLDTSYIREPTNTASKGTSSRLKEALFNFKIMVQKLDSEVGLSMAARRFSQRARPGNRDFSWVVHGETPGDSILSIFSGELLQVKLHKK